MTDCTTIDHCLACGSSNLAFQLDLGKQALANACIDNLQIDEPIFPLAVNRCRHCNHLQLTHAVDPALIYTHYLYVSGTSKTGRDHFEWFAKFAREYIGTWGGSVLDIGCNDGTQLDYFKSLGYNTYGIDPAENLYPTSSKKHHIYCDFFDTAVADKLLDDNLHPDIIVAQNSFAHNPDPLTYLKNIRRIMKPTGRFFIQTSQADMVVNNEFDTIYHEHINFYNINSMNELCKRAGLYLDDVVKCPIHGTSYIFILRKDHGRPEHIKNLIALEAAQGLMGEDRYNEWTTSVLDMREELVGRVEGYRQQGWRVIGYGAAAKGNTLLQYTRLGVEAIIDDNPLKQGLYSPGVNIPIVSIDYLDQFGEDDKIMFVPLAWNFYNEIRSRIKAKRNNVGDRFVKYFPEVDVEL
jgi:SAM-dependent methyltransferase